MRNVRAAELLLAIVMPRKRASATVGDLLESSRGGLEFWGACSRTVVGAALGQISLATSVIAILVAVGVEAAVAIPYTGLMLKLQPPGYLGLALFLGGSRLIPVLAGYVMARCLPGREVGGWIAVVLGWTAARTPFLPLGVLALSQILLTVMLLVGVLLARRNTLRKESTTA